MDIKERPERIALFIDLENFVGSCSSLGLPIDLSFEINRLTELGKVTIRRSYGDIYKLPITNVQKQELRKMLQNNLIQHEDIPYQNGYKNASDIRLVVDVLSTIHSNKEIDKVAVVASDRDFIPLFTELRNIGKDIIGIGGNREDTPDLIVNSCDYFFYHEVLSGRSPSAISATVQESSDTLMIETSSVNAIVSSTDTNSNQPDSSFADNGEEALKLLVEALKVLETGGNSWNSGSSIISMMRRFKADFDYTAYGYKNFKQLCLRALAENLIEIDDKEGTSYTIHLREANEIDTLSVVTQANEQTSGSEKLKSWFETKIKITLPSISQRESIYDQLLVFMKDFTSEEGISLSVLAENISEEVKVFSCSQPISFKLLFNLFRANCFYCMQGATINNPIIKGLRVPDINSTSLDDKFIENTLRLFQRECRVDIDCSAWSEVFFETLEQSERIAEISRKL